MSRATTLTAAAAAALVCLGSLTACGPTDPAAAPGPSGSATPVTAPSTSPSSAAPAPSSADPSAAPPVSSATASDPAGAGSTGGTGGTAGSPGRSVAGLPASVWMPPGTIPMAAAYHWGAPAAAARAVANPRFEFEQLCRSTRDPSNDLAGWKGPSAQAHVDNSAQNYADWQLQQTVIHFPGTSSAGEQIAQGLFVGLQDELNACGRSMPGAKVRVTRTGGDAGNQELAATLTVPEAGGGAYTLHQYLALTGRAVVELALWSDHPARPWAAPSDAAVLRALQAPVCPALKDC